MPSSAPRRRRLPPGKKAERESVGRALLPVEFCQWRTAVHARPTQLRISANQLARLECRDRPPLGACQLRLNLRDRRKCVKNEELLGALMTMLIVVPVSGLLGWSWYWTLRPQVRPPKQAATVMPW